MNLEQDHGATAWGYWTSRFDGKQRLEGLVRSLFAPSHTFQSALAGIKDDVWLETAAGRQLDGIGEIVGQPRYLPDTLYLAFFGYKGQRSTTGYSQARYRKPYEEARSGTSQLADDEYRKVLHWKIRANNANGTVDDLHAAITDLFGNIPRRIERTAPKALRVTLPTSQSESVLYQVAQRFMPVAAGESLQISPGDM